MKRRRSRRYYQMSASEERGPRSGLRGRVHSQPGLRLGVQMVGKAWGRALDPVADWPCLSRAADMVPGAPRSKNDCASQGEVVVYQPERTAVNPFNRYQYRFFNGNSNAGVSGRKSGTFNFRARF